MVRYLTLRFIGRECSVEERVIQIKNQSKFFGRYQLPYPLLLLAFDSFVRTTETGAGNATKKTKRLGTVALTFFLLAPKLPTRCANSVEVLVVGAGLYGAHRLACPDRLALLN